MLVLKKGQDYGQEAGDRSGQQIFHCEVVGISEIMVIFAPANPKGEA